MLDQPADRQRPRAGHGPGLLVGEPVGRDAQGVALLLDVGEEEGTFVGERRDLSGHGDLVS